MSTAKTTKPLSSQQRILLALDDAVQKLEAMEREKSEPIAIVGMGCRFPGGVTDPESFWQLLVTGTDAITPVPSDRWHTDDYYDPDYTVPGKTYSRYGGFLADVDQFDPQFFGISPREAQSLDPQQRLLLEVSWEALEASGWVPNPHIVSKTGVFVGITTNDYARLISPDGTLDGIDAYYLTGNPLNAVAGRLAYTFGFQGPCMAVDTACSSSLVAVHLAMQSLRLGECDRALVGGVNLILTPENTVALSKAQMLSADGRCKTFDASADGIVRGEGCGVVVLKRLADAQTAADPILAVIRGSAVNQDGRSSGFTVPNKMAQEALIKGALAAAKINPEDVDYIEAHGTGTPLGDPIELRGLADTLCQQRPGDEPLKVGSVKTNLGHLESAAGIAGLIKVVLALQHKAIPPHLHFREPNPHLDWSQLPIHVTTELTPWLSTRSPRLAGVSSFGASGTNAHVIVGEAEGPQASVKSGNQPDRPHHVLALSAQSPSALDDLVERYSEGLKRDREQSLPDVCFSANTGRGHFRHRLLVQASSLSELQARLKNLQQTPDDAIGGYRGEAVPGSLSVGFMFTGQGAQTLGMGRELFAQCPPFRQAMEQCSAWLERELGWSLIDLLYGDDPAAETRLNQTAYTQPALFAVEYALAQLWQFWGVRPAMVMGHSVGEYVAACLAGVFSLEDGLKLIAARGRLMQALPPGGGMVSVLTTQSQLQPLLATLPDVAIAAVNGPTSLVISGPQTQLELLTTQLEHQDIKHKSLVVSHAFHSSLMEPMLEAFEAIAAGISMHPPRLKLVSNVTGQVAGTEVATPEYWRRHVREPVQFAQGMATLTQLGCQAYLEIGPKPILLGMGRQCDGVNLDGLWLPSLRPPQSDWQSLLGSLGQLYVQGASINWSGFDQAYTRYKVALPTYPFQRQRYWVEALPSQPGTASPRLRTPEASVHPLLGQRCQMATLPSPYFASSLSLRAIDYLADHQIYQQAIVPATAYVEMALAAGKAILKRADLSLTNVSIQQPLPISSNQVVQTQVVLSPTAPNEAGDSYQFEIFSREQTVDDPADIVWTRHATGAVQPGWELADEPDSIDLDTLKLAYSEPVSVTTYYETLQRRGMAYGRAFQGIQALWKGPDGALGQVQLPPPLTDAAYCIHPALLDACFQVLGAVVNDGKKDAYLPTDIGAVRLYAPVPAQVWSQVKLHPTAGAKRRQLSADIVLWSETGAAIATIQGLTLRQIPQRLLQRVLQPNLESWLYRLDWQPLPPVSGSRRASKRWLIVSEPDGMGSALAKQLSKTGDQYLLITAGKTYQQLSATAFELDLTEPGHIEQLIAETGSVEHPFDSIVHLLGTHATPHLDSQTIESAQLQGCGSLLHLVQALVKTQASAFPRLWVVTRGVHQIIEAAPLQPQFGSLWGMGRVIALEHPDLHCTCLDLEPAASQPVSETDLSRLVAELHAGDAQAQIAYRQQQRYGARLVRYRSAPLLGANGLEIPDQPYQLRLKAYGALENLHLTPMQRQTPGPTEVEIAVRAVGLNFRDVLNALGMLQEVTAQLGITDTADLPFGGECSGVVTAVGEQVSHVQVGDAVIAAQTIGSLASHVRVPAAFVIAKPNSLSFEAAATIPTAFLTAYYGLHHLAQLQADERVLIHAASGGVGQAAIQIGQWLGAEVWGTASEPKWATVKAMGVSEIFNSRTLDFAEHITALTAGQGVDVILNSLNGDFIPASLSVLGQQGRFVELGKLGIWTSEQVMEACPNASYLPFDLLDLSFATPELITTLLQEVMAQFEAGQFVPLPHQVFPLQDGVEAFRFMAQAKHIGKVVIALPNEGTQSVKALPQEPESSSAETLGIQPDCSYLITGGLGALGLEVAEWLTGQGAKQLILTGRRSPSEQGKAAIARLEARGTAVEIISADISEPASVTALMDLIQAQLPPLKGIFHAAGMLDDGMLAGQSWERFATVMAPKVMGTWLLHEQSQACDLDYFVCFSSVSAVVGSPGQANYAAANAFMDALAHYRHSLGLPALSINWGPWSQSGMAAALQSRDQARWASQGVSLIEPRQGLNILQQLLTSTRSQVAVLPVDWERYLTQAPPEIDLSFLEHVATVAQTPERSPQLRLDLQKALPHKRKSLLLQRLQSLLAKVMGLTPDQINPQRGFAELGMDSLMAVEMRSLLQADLGCSVPTTIAFDYPTVEALADYLLETLPFETDERPSQTVAAQPSVDDTLAPPDTAPDYELDDLSSDELADLLAQELLAIKEEKA
ncbi:MAG: type I polyketide synthase [Leptolyngbya sp. SIOISBB]|nr:type I polyketide synthase [Leptolyngbya sp. SIOISBB]